MVADMADEASFYVVDNNNQQRGDRISLDSLTWSHDESAEWITLRRRAELRAAARPTAAHGQRESVLLRQLEMFMRRRGYTVAAIHGEVNSDMTAIMATAGAMALKLAFKYLAGVTVSVPRAAGNYASKDSLHDAASHLLRAADICGLNYGLLQLHPASGMVAILADTLSTVDVLWRLEMCVMAALRLKEFAVAANGQNGFFMRPIILCYSTEAYSRHARIISRMGFVERGDQHGTVGSCVSLIDLSKKVVMFQRRPGLLGRLQQTLERPFGAKDLDELLSL